MKKNNIITLVALAGLMLSGFFLFRSCRAEAVLKQAKSDYTELKKITEADHALMSIRVDNLTKEIGVKDKAIVDLEAKVATKDLELRAARQDLADLQNAEPAQPELEKEPLVINLRGQIAKLTEMFTLSTEALTLRDREIAELKGKVILIEQVAAEWKAGFEREHALRVAAEGLFKKSERARESNRTIKNIALGIAGAGVLYGLLK